jgi:hypothetical protein
VTFHPIVTFRLFVTSHPDCFLRPFFPFCDICQYATLVLLCDILSIHLGVTVRRNRYLSTNGSVCRVP